jgi:hypothetical protein
MDAIINHQWTLLTQSPMNRPLLTQSPMNHPSLTRAFAVTSHERREAGKAIEGR